MGARVGLYEFPTPIAGVGRIIRIHADHFESSVYHELGHHDGSRM